MLREAGNSNNVALSLSAGTDSSIILFTLLDLGCKPTCYTYYLEGTNSRDWNLAQQLAAHYGLTVVGCPIPNDLNSLCTDVKTLIHTHHIKGKVAIQCCHGHLYVAQQVTERYIFNGSGVDGIYGCYRQFVLSGASKNKTLFDNMRNKHLAKPNDDAMLDQQRIYNHYGSNHGGTQVFFPYRNKSILDYLMSLSWAQINSPKWKYVAVRDYLEHFQATDHYRQRGSQQLVAGVREFHDNLLHSPLNKHGRDKVTKIYVDVEAEGSVEMAS